MRDRTSVLLLALLGLVAGSCVENSGSLVILQNQIPGAGCVVDSSESGTYRSQGVLDVAWSRDYGHPAPYYLFPLVKNNLVSTKDDSTGAIEENCLTNFRIQVDLSLGSLSEYVESDFTRYETSAGATICPGETRALTVVVIPTQVVDVVGPMIGETEQIYANASIRIIGERGGRPVESASWNFPIILCYRCLITLYSTCSEESVPESPAQGNPCNPAQDEYLDCCTYTNEIICPAVTHEETTE